MFPPASDFGLNVVRSAGNEEYCLCPFHTDTKPSASYNRRKGLFYCYVCQLGLNTVQLSSRLGLSITDLDEWVKINEEPEEYNFVNEDERIELGQFIYHDYFQKRGIGKESILEYGVSWKSSEPEATVFPIVSMQGNVQGAVYRYQNMEAAGTRYKKIGQMSQLWPLPFLKRAKEGEVIYIVEGGFSALRIHTAFVRLNEPPPVILALFGARANSDIADLVRPFKPVFLYDKDNAGQHACRRMRRVMPTCHAWTLTMAPDDMSFERIYAMLNLIEKKVRE